ncbi:MAG: DUF1844 domain-containing protein [Polyangiales bacterium]
MPEGLPSLDFSTLVLSLSQTALMHLGDVADPSIADAELHRDLRLARQTIDLLGVLQEKTKGNLTGEEERLLDQLLYDLRLRFVEHSKEEAAKKEGK